MKGRKSHRPVGCGRIILRSSLYFIPFKLIIRDSTLVGSLITVKGAPLRNSCSDTIKMLCACFDIKY